ncbi:MAG: SDR family oxidoreductase [Bacteroidales bacterium]|nr:SDR family oxidoreductase [Bacteroidales bacterium]MCF8403115.1 SDR family oxidoreductase [Bacteroidales bacterium]
MEPKILVTGATGTIGSFVVDLLKDKKANFVAMVRNQEKAKPFKEKGIKTVVADFSKPALLERALEGIHKIFLLSVTSPEAPALQASLVEKAFEARVQHIVKVSVRGADPNANFNIGRWHGETEEVIRKSLISYTFLQPHSFLQNLLFDAQSIREEGKIYSMQGDGQIPMVDARDIASVAVKALLEPGHEKASYVLTGPQSISYHDIAREFSVALDKDVEYIKQSTEEGISAMLEAGMPRWLADDMAYLNTRYANNEDSDVSPVIEKVLGTKAHNLVDFIQDYIHIFK